MAENVASLQLPFYLSRVRFRIKEIATILWYSPRLSLYHDGQISVIFNLIFEILKPSPTPHLPSTSARSQKKVTTFALKFIFLAGCILFFVQQRNKARRRLWRPQNITGFISRWLTTGSVGWTNIMNDIWWKRRADLPCSYSNVVFLQLATLFCSSDFLHFKILNSLSILRLPFDDSKLVFKM